MFAADAGLAYPVRVPEDWTGMSQQREGASGRAGDLRGWARLALAACLLALIAAALRVRVPAPALDGSFRHDALQVGAVLEAVLGCLMATLLVRNARAPRGALLAAQLRKLLLYAVGTGLVAIPVAYLLSKRLGPVHPARNPSTASKHLAGKPPPPPAVTSPYGVIIVIIVLSVLVLALLVYLIVAFLGSGTWRRLRKGPPGTALAAADGTDESDLRDAVESGRRALGRFDDARAAIIACYVAMEQQLASAGTARDAADTPDELLARASGQGLVRGDAAARLTALFYEARFSTHPVPPARREDAQQALAELAGSLADREPAGAASRASGDGPAGTGPGDSG
jgi:Domain of unknown function (DUF4129)